MRQALTQKNTHDSFDGWTYPPPGRKRISSKVMRALLHPLTHTPNFHVFHTVCAAREPTKERVRSQLYSMVM